MKLQPGNSYSNVSSLSWNRSQPVAAVKTVVKYNEGSRTPEEQLRPTKPSYAQALKPNTTTLKK